jgi:transposase-like protein
MIITKEMENEYLFFGGNQCPYCKSARIIGHGIDYGGLEVRATIECKNCGKFWQDIFTLVGIEAVED